jgi:hypothetical protein
MYTYSIGHEGGAADGDDGGRANELEEGKRWRIREGPVGCATGCT